MPITPAIQQLAPAHLQAQQTYQQAVAAAQVLMVSVSSSNLPALNTTPANWPSFVSAFEAAKAQAQGWFNDVGVSLVEVPLDVRNYNTEVSSLLTLLAQQAASLQADPGNANLAALFNGNLTLLSQTLTTVEQFIVGCAGRIQQFTDSLPQLAGQLEGLASQFGTEVSADQAAVAALQDSINALNADILSLGTQIAAEGIALDAAIIVARFTPAWTPVTIVVKLLATATVAALTYVIATDTAEIATDLAKVKTAGDALNADSADAAACQLQATAFGDFATSVTAVQGGLQTVLQAWQALQAEIQAAITDAAKASADAGSAAFQAAAADLQSASAEWDAVYGQAGSLQVDLDVSTAELQYGMSSAAVSQALAAGQTVPIQQFVAGAT